MVKEEQGTQHEINRNVNIRLMASQLQIVLSASLRLRHRPAGPIMAIYALRRRDVKEDARGTC